ncbi:hypothetical protein RINTHH_4670 [Richelia intracellularis HH01]|uniref:Uncharacterized protein n=1 Tax=Richelia intracellularis HH01 TaxID=1165094 RepID=M1WY16_9NOST|nr:hypothetical protein [Richelia intracellularis]CCH66622.1 hypothetical protein RINTHH_4670 [Richelia intracellularis HH01]
MNATVNLKAENIPGKLSPGVVFFASVVFYVARMKHNWKINLTH